MAVRGCLAAGLAAALLISAQPQASTPTFSSTSNLVPVTVVVRDKSGHAVGNLNVDSFQLFDNGKPQMISRFVIEKLETESPASQRPAVGSTESAANGSQLTDANTDGIPNRFVAYLFDDLHMTPTDLHYPREAAERQIENLHALERMAIYTTSGKQMTDFTADREKLRSALASLNTGQANATRAMQTSTCPPMTSYMGDQIYNHNDQQAFAIALQDAAACSQVSTVPKLQQLVNEAAREAFFMGDRESQWSIDALNTVIGKEAAMPGQRTIVLISPGFVVPSERLTEETGMIDRAIRASIVINALDARGVYTNIPGSTAEEKSPPDPTTVTARDFYTRRESMEQAEVMDTLAAGTGGVFYKGSNDMNDGLARTAAAPEYLYVLAFHPLGMKPDGSYHNLKIVLRDVKGMEAQARKGYYAPRTAANPEDQAQQDIRDEFFSGNTVQELPANLQTQYFRGENGDTTLSAVAKIDVKKLSFRKEEDRNRNDVTVLTGLFDADGNYITGNRKIMQLRLLDQTLETRVAGGIALKSSFTVHAGRYVVRMVVRDTEGQLMSAQSSMVEIP